jgi:hypothetical protein
MFKDFSNTNQFKGFPSINFGMNKEAYGFSNVVYRFSSEFGIEVQNDNDPIERWMSIYGHVLASQPTLAQRPRFKVSNPLFNNFPTVNFHDNARNMLLSKGVSNNETMLVIANMDTINSDWNAVLSNNVASNSWNVILGGGRAEIVGAGYYVDTGTTNLLIGTSEITTPQILIITKTHVMVNGVLETTGTAPDILNRTIFNQIGRSFSYTSTALIGNIADIVSYGTKLTLDQMYILSDTVNNKFLIY